MESSIKVEELRLDFLLYRKRGMTFKEWFVGQFNGNERRVRKNEVFTALSGINLEVRQGERLGIVGPNGAGKTTLLKCISGIYEPTAGTVTVGGSITPLIEISAGFNPELSGRDNIYLHGAIRGMNREEIRAREEEVVDFADIDGFIDVPTKYYSSGMMSRLAFSIATAIDPEILVLDEVFSAGDAKFVKKARVRIQEIIDAAHIMLLVSHNENLIRELCTRTIWLYKGRIVADGEPAEVMKYYNADVRLTSAKELFFLRNVDPNSYSTLRNIELSAGRDSKLETGADLRSRGVKKTGNPEKPLLSVVVVAEKGKDLDRCIRSVLIQPYDNIELIVVEITDKRPVLDADHPYHEAVDLWLRMDTTQLEDAIRSGVTAAHGSIIHVLYASDALADDVYSSDLLRLVVEKGSPCLLDYHVFCSDGKIGSPSLPPFHPLLIRALLLPKTLYERIGFRSVQEFLHMMTCCTDSMCFPPDSASVYLEEASENMISQAADYLAADMSDKLRSQLAAELKEVRDSALLWRLSPQKRETVLRYVAASFVDYVHCLPDKAIEFEAGRVPGVVFFDTRTSAEKIPLVISGDPMQHPFLRVVDKLFHDFRGRRVFVPDCVFRDWISFFGARGSVVSGADLSSHILAIDAAYRSHGYSIGELVQVNPIDYESSTKYDFVFSALYSAFYLDPQRYFVRIRDLVAPGKYLFVGFWNFGQGLQRRINRAINPRFAAALNPIAMDKEKIMGWLPGFVLVERGYCGGIEAYVSNEQRDSQQASVLGRLRRELVFVRRFLNEPSPEWSVLGYLFMQKLKSG